MIHGVGTDICRVERFRRMLEKYGDKTAQRVLDPREYAEFGRSPHPARFLARRFAAKEAFAKALGSGVREPALLTAMRVEHDALGKPRMECAGELATLMREEGLVSHLSISDEAEFAVAFVVMERDAT